MAQNHSEFYHTDDDEPYRVHLHQPNEEHADESSENGTRVLTPQSTLSQVSTSSSMNQISDRPEYIEDRPAASGDPILVVSHAEAVANYTPTAASGSLMPARGRQKAMLLYAVQCIQMPTDMYAIDSILRCVNDSSLTLSERQKRPLRKMHWQEKDMLIIDEVGMLGARTLHAVNEQLCSLRESRQDFGGIPVILFCGDFRQFRPVRERSILLPSATFPWDEEKSFTMEQRRQHDKAHALWKKFTTAVILTEQVRAAGDPTLRQLLTRIRRGVQEQSDVDLSIADATRRAGE